MTWMQVVPAIPPAVASVLDVYREIKFWLPICAAGGLIFRGLNWLTSLKTTVETIRSNDLTHIHSMVEDMSAGLVDQTRQFTTAFKEQTGAIVGELKELRQDIRTGPPRWHGEERRK